MRVVIAEDSVLLRAGLVTVLTRGGIEVVAEVADGDALLRAVEGMRPDLALMDVRMPPDFADEGVRAALEVKRRWPGVAVLLLSQYVEENYAADLLAGHAGGLGYLLKDRVADVEEFLEAVRRVAGGGTALDPEVVAQLLARRRTAPLRQLTPRETEVLGTMAEGRSNGAIATALGISGHSVEKHVNNIFTKLGLVPADTDHRRVLAVLHYLERGERT